MSRRWAGLCAAVAVMVAVGCSEADGPTPVESKRVERAADEAVREAGVSRSDAREQDREVGRRAAARAVAWLVAKQHADGAWRSETYGRMRVGVGSTAVVVYGLAQFPVAKYPDAHAAAVLGLNFTMRNISAAGYVRGLENETDYPTYATALVLAALPKLKVEVPAGDVARMQAYLRAAQLRPQQGREQMGREPADIEFGGWNQTGGEVEQLGTWDQSSISATRVALEGLAAGGALDAATRDAALKFLARCQNWDADAAARDGGFYFTPDTADARNKAGSGTDKQALSYGSATADGLLGLELCGVPPESPRRRAAVAWLERRFNADAVPGFPDTAEKRPSADGLYYYYAAALADVLRRTPALDSTERRSALIRALVARQRPDGSWRNPSSQMNEDDPLIATALALAALGRLCD